MCSVNDEEGEIGLMEEKEILEFVGSKPSCRKCSVNEAEVVLRGKDPYCRSCFLTYVTHKFRASLGKSKLVRKGDKVLVGFSGSSNSLALLRLIKAGIEEDAHKRIVFEPFIIYIDEGAAFNMDYESRNKTLKDITHILKQFNIVSYISNLDCIFHSNGEKRYFDLDSKLPVASDSALSRLFSKVKCPSSKEELLVKLRNNLLLDIAKELGCSKILTAETIVITASKLLTNVSLGRGAQLPFDIGFCDSRVKDIKILRPMQDFGKEEIDFYCKIYNLSPITIPSLKSNEHTSTSIQMLTRKFVDDLQENFPSTISTVYRTGTKLMIDDEVAVEKCPLCKGPLDTNVTESSSLQATIYSGLISKCGPSSVCSSDREVQQGINGASSSCNGNASGCKCSNTTQEKSVSKDDAIDSLCYGCRLIVAEIESIELLPKDIVKTITENCSLRQMKNEIQDFLL